MGSASCTWFTRPDVRHQDRSGPLSAPLRRRLPSKRLAGLCVEVRLGNLYFVEPAFTRCRILLREHYSNKHCLIGPGAPERVKALAGVFLDLVHPEGAIPFAATGPCASYPPRWGRGHRRPVRHRRLHPARRARRHPRGSADRHPFLCPTTIVEKEEEKETPVVA